MVRNRSRRRRSRPGVPGVRSRTRRPVVGRRGRCRAGYPVEPDLAVVRVGQAPGERGQQGFPGSGAAHDGGERARGQVEVDAVQEGVAPGAAYGHVAELQSAAAPGGQARAAVRGRGFPQYLRDPPGGGAGEGELPRRGHQRTHPGGQHDVLGGGQRLTRCDAAPGELHPGHRQHGDLQQGDDHRVPRGDPGVRAPQPHAVAVQFGQRLQHPVGLAVHGARRGDRADSRKRVGEPGGDAALRGEVAVVEVGDVTDEGADHQDDQRQSGDEGEAQPGVDQGQGHHGPDRRDQVGHRPHQARRGAPGPGGVAHEPGHQVAGGVAAGGAGAQVEDVSEQGVPQPGRGARVGDGAGVVVRRVAHHEQPDGDGGQGQPQRGVTLSQYGVDRAAHDGGQGDVDPGEEEGRGGQEATPPSASADRRQQQTVRRASVHRPLPSS